MSESEKLCEQMARESLELVIGKTPWPWQVAVATHVAKMRHTLVELEPNPCLCVQATAGGKSAVRDALGYLFGGVTLTIVPHLSLGSQQAAKLDKRIQELRSTGAVAWHLDEIKQSSKAQQEKVVDFLSSLKPGDGNVVYLFSSPQTITSKDSTFYEVVQKLVAEKVMEFFCIDEIHLHVKYSLHFRKEFLQLRFVLLEKCRGVPLLLLTATATKTMLELLPQVIGKEVTPPNIFWGSNEAVSRRDVLFAACNYSSTLQKFKELVEPLLLASETGDVRKAILYGTTVEKVDAFHQNIESWLDGSNLVGDVVKIVGSMKKEQKFHNTRVFTCPDEDNAADPFRPRILVATNCAKEGIDDPGIHLVVHGGFPRSVEDSLQVSGRVGRYGQSNPAMDQFYVLYDLESFIDIFESIYRVKKDDTTRTHGAMTMAEYQEFQRKSFMEVVQLLVLDQGCLHLRLEAFASNPFAQPTLLSQERAPCGGSCSACRDVGSRVKDRFRYFRPVNVVGARALLLDLFVQGQGNSLLLQKELPHAIVDYPESARLLFDSTAKKPELRDVKMFLLQLLAASILEPSLSTPATAKEDPKVLVHLKLDTNLGALLISLDSAWRGIPRVDD